MGFSHISDDEDELFYYRLEYITYEQQENGKFTINCTLFKYTHRNGELMGYAPIILQDVELDIHGDIIPQIYIAVKKAYFIDFDDVID